MNERYNTKIKEYRKLYYQKNRIKILERNKLRYENNKLAINAYAHKWYLKNKKRLFETRKIYEKIRRKTDLNFKLSCNLRWRVWSALKGLNKSKSTIKLLDCSFDYLKSHLESQFTEGMSWSNYGRKGWHIDHIRPCASFDMSKSEEQAKCFHYTNLQPLWAKDNLSKNNKFEA